MRIQTAESILSHWSYSAPKVLSVHFQQACLFKHGSVTKPLGKK